MMPHETYVLQRWQHLDTRVGGKGSQTQSVLADSWQHVETEYTSKELAMGSNTRGHPSATGS